MIRKNKRRYFLSLLILTLYGAAMGIAGLASQYGPTPVISTWMILTPIAGYFLGMVWQFDLVLRVREKESETTGKSGEKRKREVIDDALRDLSDDDLIRLKHRLEDGSIDDDVLYDHMVGDDGEIKGYN